MIQFIYIYLHASGACDDRSGGINWHDYCSFVAGGVLICGPQCVRWPTWRRDDRCRASCHYIFFLCKRALAQGPGPLRKGPFGPKMPMSLYYANVIVFLRPARGALA